MTKKNKEARDLVEVSGYLPNGVYLTKRFKSFEEAEALERQMIYVTSRLLVPVSREALIAELKKRGSWE